MTVANTYPIFTMVGVKNQVCLTISSLKLIRQVINRRILEAHGRKVAYKTFFYIYKASQNTKCVNSENLMQLMSIPMHETTEINTSFF